MPDAQLIQAGRPYSSDFFNAQYYGVDPVINVSKNGVIPNNSGNKLYMMNAAQAYQYMIDSGLATGTAYVNDIGKAASIVVLGSGVYDYTGKYTIDKDANGATVTSRNYGLDSSLYTTLQYYGAGTPPNPPVTGKPTMIGTVTCPNGACATGDATALYANVAYSTQGLQVITSMTNPPGQTEWANYARTLYECAAGAGCATTAYTGYPTTTTANLNHGVVLGHIDPFYSGTVASMIIGGTWSQDDMFANGHGVSQAEIISVKTNYMQNFTATAAAPNQGGTWWLASDTTGRQFLAALQYTTSLAAANTIPAVVINTSLVTYNNQQATASCVAGTAGATNCPGSPNGVVAYNDTIYVSSLNRMVDVNNLPAGLTGNYDTFGRYGMNYNGMGTTFGNTVQQSSFETTYKAIQDEFIRPDSKTIYVLSSHYQTHVNIAYDAAKNALTSNGNNTLLVAGVDNTSSGGRLQLVVKQNNSNTARITPNNSAVNLSTRFYGCSSFGTPAPTVVYDGVTYANCVVAPSTFKAPNGVIYTDSVNQQISNSASYVAGVFAVMASAMPNLSPQEIKKKMIVTADRRSGLYEGGYYSTATLKADPRYGAGLVDLYAMIIPQGTAVIPGGSQVGSPGVSIDISGSSSPKFFGDSIRLQSSFLSRAIFFDSFGFYYNAGLDKRALSYTDTKSNPAKRYLDSKNDRAFVNQGGTVSFMGGAASFQANVRTPDYGFIEREEFSSIQSMPSSVNKDMYKMEVQVSFATNISPDLALQAGYGLDLAEVYSFAPQAIRIAENLGDFGGFDSNYLTLTGTSNTTFGAIKHQINESVSMTMAFSAGFSDELDKNSMDMASQALQDSYREVGGGTNIFSQVEYSKGPLSFGINFGSVFENNQFLGTRVSGAFDVGDDARTDFMGLGVNLQLQKGLFLTAALSRGMTQVDSVYGSIYSDFSKLYSSSMALGVSKLAEDGKSSYGLVYSEPLRVTSGEVTMTISTDRDIEGNVKFESQRVSLSPSGKERNLEAFYMMRLTAVANFYASYLYRINPDHIAENSSENVVAFKVKAGF